MIASRVATICSAGNGASRRASASAASSAAPREVGERLPDALDHVELRALREIPGGEPREVAAVADPERDPPGVTGLRLADRVEQIRAVLVVGARFRAADTELHELLRAAEEERREPVGRPQHAEEALRLRAPAERGP